MVLSSVHRCVLQRQWLRNRLLNRHVAACMSKVVLTLTSLWAMAWFTSVVPASYTCWNWRLPYCSAITWHCAAYTCTSWCSITSSCNTARRKEGNVYLTMHSTHFIYCYMASDIWLRTILIVRKETSCRHIGYSFRLAARVAHTTAFVTPVVEHWLEREIAQWVHPMKDRSDDPSHHERMLLPRSYILLRKIGRSQMFYLTTYSITVVLYWTYSKGPLSKKKPDAATSWATFSD